MLISASTILFFGIDIFKEKIRIVLFNSGKGLVIFYLVGLAVNFGLALGRF